jgi:4-amino-4-deoxy-L-arabinose transferase-like glycosyltransferase
MGKNTFNSNTRANSKNLNLFGMRFTKFVVYSLIILFSIILISNIYYMYLYKQYKDFTLENIALIVIYLVLANGLIYGIQKKISKKKLFYLILLAGFSLRLIWALTTNSSPVSDFKTMYDAANNLLEGDTSAFMGLGYFARFPHMTTYVLFLSQMIRFFGNNTLFVVKMLNVLLSTSSIIFVYLICNSIFKDYKRTLFGAFFIAILPSSILYVPVYCTENVAIPFYLASIYCFILVINNKKNSLYLLLSGLLLSVGHLFRMVAYIVLIAYIMYILIYDTESFKIKLRNIIFIVVPFAMLFTSFSNILIAHKITDTKLWSGSEPAITSAVRGSNIESGGSWNPEDAEFISNHLEDKDALEKASRDRILNRYTTTPPLDLAKFFIGKFASQWLNGDNAGAYWSQADIPENKIKIDIAGKGVFWYQSVYAVLLLLIIKGLFSSKEYLGNRIINLFYIIVCGYGVTFLILETQTRYAFIISFIFAILPVTSISSDNKMKN